MDYLDIKDAAKAYCDRYDDELESAIPYFMRVVESKVNSALKTGEQSVRSQIYLEVDQEYYGLPDDWAGFRDVERLSPGQRTGTTLSYLAPEAMNKINQKYYDHRRHPYYTVIANQIQVSAPATGSDEILEVVYYQKVPRLSSDQQSNWLSERAPDVYIFGLCSEISAFAKDEVLFQGYDFRFKEALSQLTQDDQVTRWSGPSLQVQVEGPVV
jgi:hypothetical protein